jgi:EAL domain-containing protein (putative c-di-GMP-specific phosphodiesterase class I)/ActR/RegA family two-component response regulator
MATYLPVPALETPNAAHSLVLLIDDQLPLLECMSVYLRRELECDVHCAVDREEAEALLESYRYSLVIADLSLTSQRLEGLDLIGEAAAKHERPQIIVLSGQMSDRAKSAALTMGADAFLEKPCSMAEIVSTLRQLKSTKSCPSPKQPSTGRLLQQVLSQGGITPLVQPIVRLDGNTPKLDGVECLTRGPVDSPFQRADALFAYARHKRAEHIVDRHCISTALEAAAAIRADIRLSLNVHASTLGRSGDFCDWLCSVAAKNSIDPQRLTIEIIEHTAVWNKSEFLDTLAALRNAGMRIALDDIGLGHSNFKMMIDAKPDYFKLDRYFVHGCHRDKSRQAVVASMAKLAEELDGSVIAEGIEDLEDLEVLQNAGIVLFQGFLFGRPVPFDQFRETQESGEFCAGSLESRTEASECELNNLALCS